jgi:putative transposase
VPRPLRVQVEGGVYHLVSRGVRKLPIFMSDEDRRQFLALLELTAKRYSWQIHAYCLMTNHFHLLVTTDDATVSAGMQFLNGRYAQWFNRKHEFEGHVLEKRFWSSLVETDDHLFAIARYIVLNPVRAGLCASPGDWSWSSYRATVATVAGVPRLSRWLLEMFGDELAAARAHFAAFIRTGETAAPG